MAGAGYKDWSAGDVPTATQFDTNLQEQTLMVFPSAAARDTALATVKAEGMTTYQLDSNTYTMYTGTTWSTIIGTAHGVLPAWTPTITQGVTVAYTGGPTYSRAGRRIHANCRLDITGSGTASNLVTVSLPVAAVSTGDVVIGAGYLQDLSATQAIKAIVAVVSGGTTAYMINSASSNQPLTQAALGSGASSQFTAGLASGDIISMSISYEAAADA